MILSKVALAGITATLALAGTAAHASLVFLGTADLQGTGIGAVNTILTLQSPGSSSEEEGSVGLNSSGVQVTSGNVLTGASQTQVRSFSSVGVTSAANLRLIFNAQEPGGPGNSIELEDLVLRVFTPTGTQIFSSGPFSERNFAATQTGVGNAGEVFALDATQAAALQTAATAGGAVFGSAVMGLSAEAENATGGPETFFVTSAGGLPPLVGPIPEPGTLALLASGLLFAGGVARRRTHRAA